MTDALRRSMGMPPELSVVERPKPKRPPSQKEIEGARLKADPTIDDLADRFVEAVEDAARAHARVEQLHGDLVRAMERDHCHRYVMASGHWLDVATRIVITEPR
jgi:hypothetical protein